MSKRYEMEQDGDDAGAHCRGEPSVKCQCRVPLLVPSNLRWAEVADYATPASVISEKAFTWCWFETGFHFDDSIIYQ